MIKYFLVQEDVEGETIVVIPEGTDDKMIVVQEGAEGETIVVLPERAEY